MANRGGSVSVMYPRIKGLNIETIVSTRCGGSWLRITVTDDNGTTHEIDLFPSDGNSITVTTNLAG